MNQGWIKLHRKLLDNALMTKSAYFHLWVTLLLKANHKETTFIFNNKEQKLYPGQLLTGLHKLRKITKIPIRTIRRILNYLENGNMIKQQITSKFRIISITNWETYQAYEIEWQSNGNQAAIDRQSDGNQAATYKNDKNDKNEKNVKNYGGNFSSDRILKNQIIDQAMEQLKAEGVF
ncbi:MAG: hypothetical protein WC374_06510 [Phycisphaerae bacterium]|jgi:hypothetical protein